MLTIELTAPSHWASYLINNDASGIGAETIAKIHAWLDRENVGFPLSCYDAGFLWLHDAAIESPLGDDCQTYVFNVAPTYQHDCTVCKYLGIDRTAYASEGNRTPADLYSHGSTLIRRLSSEAGDYRSINLEFWPSGHAIPDSFKECKRRADKESQS